MELFSALHYLDLNRQIPAAILNENRSSAHPVTLFLYESVFYAYIKLSLQLYDPSSVTSLINCILFK